MKKKILTLCLVIALVAIAAVSATLAYFTDTDINYNTMVFGTVEIDQFEKQIVYAEDGTPVGMEDFVNDKVIMPAAGKPAYEKVFGQWSDLDAANTGEYAGEEFAGGNELWAEHMNAQDKVVFVKNTGNNDVYYRTIILLENPEIPADSDISYAPLRPNANGNALFDWDASTDGVQSANKAVEYTYITYNGVRYHAVVATYTDTLEKDEISRPSLVQVAMDETCTQEYAALFGEKLDVYCFTQAVQAEGFDDAHSALNAAFGEVSVDNIQTWINTEAVKLSA